MRSGPTKGEKGWDRVEKLYHEALSKPQEQRAQFLESACRGDEGLRREVESLMDSIEKNGARFEARALEVAARMLAKDQAAEHRPDLVNRTVAHYSIIRKIGEGGMGEVHLARDLRLERQVTIKVLPEAFAKDPERLVRFEREAKLLASLNHPNVAAIHGLEVSDGQLFLVLELVEGETLAEPLSRGPLSVPEALEICRQIADGLEAAHEKGIIHRDLKPANVKVTPEGKVKILDFGLAKAFYEQGAPVDPSRSPAITEQMTAPGVILGTAAYMSPEQAKGKAVDKKADIWAFGCILFECLTGKRAFEGETPAQTLASVLQGEPDWQTIPGATPWQTGELLRGCLEKDPRERFHDIADVRIEITKQVSHAVLPESAPAGAVRRGPLPAAVVVTLLIMATVASLVTWWLKPTPAQPDVRAVNDLPVNMQLTREGIGPAYTELALAPDGRNLVFSASPNGAQEKAMLYLRYLGTFEACTL